jgi:hypothetical protein
VFITAVSVETHEPKPAKSALGSLMSGHRAINMYACGLLLITALALVEYAAAFSAPALLASRAVVGSHLRCSGARVYFLKSLKQAQDPPSTRATAAKERNYALRLYAEAGGGGKAVDENYYSVAAIRGKQAVANPARGGMVASERETQHFHTCRVLVCVTGKRESFARVFDLHLCLCAQKEYLLSGLKFRV